MMKFRALLIVSTFSVCLFLALFAQAQQQDPQELIDARNNYINEKEKAVKPVNTRYLPKLEELKRQLTLRGDLKGALKVDQDIEKIANSQILSTQENDPQELIKMKKTYSEEIQTALKPVHSLYLAKLEVLKQQLAQSGNLKGALAVEQEMNNHNNTVADNLESYLLSNAWTLAWDQGSKDIKFERNGIISIGRNPTGENTWRLDGKMLKIYDSTGQVFTEYIIDSGGNWKVTGGTFKSRARGIFKR